MALQVRWGRVEDAASVGRVHVRAWQEGYAGLLPRDLRDGLRPEDRLTRWSAALSAADPPGSGTLVAVAAGSAGSPHSADDGGRLLGFAQLGPLRNGEGHAAPGDHAGHCDVGEVLFLYVDPDVWRQGIGRALMAAVVEALSAAGYDRALLWVLEGNERAIAFYRHTGWEPDGARKADVVAGRTVHDLRMSRALP